MNDRELHLRSKASESRVRARRSIGAAARETHEKDAVEWDRQAEAIASPEGAGEDAADPLSPPFDPPF